MARDLSLLTSTQPTAIAPAQVTISHVQLRDLVICPRERGLVNYVQCQSIVEQNLNAPDISPRTLAELSFTPNCLTSLAIGENDTLLAAGGQEAEIHLSYHTPSSAGHTSLVWQYERQLLGSINNSVLLTGLSLTRSNQSAAEPRVGISNNDYTVKMYDIPIRGSSQKRSIREAGCLKLDVPVNHSSISPDGRTLLSVGDSSKVYFHHISGSSRLTFTPILNLILPPPDVSPLTYPSSSLAASFSTAFSSDGSKFAVASQEGVVAVWDVRSSKPLKVLQTNKARMPSGTSPGNGSASGWLSDDPWEWTRGSSKAPGWSVRSVKFGTGGVGSEGKEVLAFTEHTSLLHIVDARTFDSEETICVPTVRNKRPSSPSPSPAPIQSSTSAVISPTTSPTSQTARTTPQAHPPITRRYLLTPTPPSRISSASPPRFISSPRRSQPTIVQALGDAFRIPSGSSTTSNTSASGAGASSIGRAYSPPSSISDSTWRTLRMGTRTHGDQQQEQRDREREEREREEREYEDILVIPPLGDRDVESEVHALLEVHGIQARRARELGVLDDDDEEGEDDEDDEDEGEDGDVNPGSTHVNYRYHISPRPPPIASRGGSTHHPQRALIHSHAPRAHPHVSQRPSPDSMEVDELDREHELECTTPSRSTSPSPSTTVGVGVGVAPSATRWRPEVGYEDDLDLAGVCFDPSGGYVYVASTDGVSEWCVRGHEKRWWGGIGEAGRGLSGWR